MRTVASEDVGVSLPPRGIAGRRAVFVTALRLFKGGMALMHMAAVRLPVHPPRPRDFGYRWCISGSKLRSSPSGRALPASAAQSVSVVASAHAQTPIAMRTYVPHPSCLSAL